MHGASQVTANGQTQTGTAKAAASAAVGLTEGRKDLLLLLGWNANAGIGDGNVQLLLALVVQLAIDPNADASLLGELHGVADQVGDDLANAFGIAKPEHWQFTAVQIHQIQPFAAGRLPKQRMQLGQQGVEVELNLFQLQLAGFNLRQVENVVQNIQQGMAAAVDNIQIVALVFVQLGVQCQLGGPQNAVHRCANLVAHVGQKHRLGAVGLLCLSQRFADFDVGGFQRFLVGNVL